MDELTDELAEPILRPHLVEALKERPRLVDDRFRKALLESLERSMRERRTPEVMAERLSEETVRSVVDVTQPVVRDKARERLDNFNDSVMEGL